MKELLTQLAVTVLGGILIYFIKKWLNRNVK